jgi:hypothetical protein
LRESAAGGSPNNSNTGAVDVTNCRALTALPDVAMDWRAAPPLCAFVLRLAMAFYTRCCCSNVVAMRLVDPLIAECCPPASGVVLANPASTAGQHPTLEREPPHRPHHTSQLLLSWKKTRRAPVLTAPATDGPGGLTSLNQVVRRGQPTPRIRLLIRVPSRAPPPVVLPDLAAFCARMACSISL